MTRTFYGSRPLLLSSAALMLCAASARGGYRDEIGWTKLAAELGAAMPSGAGVGVSQVEAPESPGNYGPNTASGDFAGKTFIPKSGAAGNSGHATIVGGYYYGLGNSVAPGVTAIDVYEVNNFIGSGFLKTNTTVIPAAETRAVQNHSWVAQTYALAVDALRRFDFAIQQNEFTGVVAVNNGNAGNVPALLASSYNSISVGLTNGGHSYGTNTTDGTGRTKPEIVAPESFTSFATPMVSATAAMVRQTAPVNGQKAVTMKSILLAGATKTQFPGWNRTTTRPIDAIYGAGQVNVYRSHRILSAGEQEASASVSVGWRGWDYNTTAAAGRLYFFDIAAGNTAPDFSALVTWNRVVTDGDPGATWGSPTSSLANLTLKLYAATGFTKGALIDSSESAVDNIEHIYKPALAPGRYVLEVTSGSLAVPYGLAWYAQPTITVAATAPNAAEAGPAAGTFTFTRAGTITAPLTVPYTVSGNATAGTDFAALPGTVTFAAGAATATATVTPLADSVAEGNETVVVTLAGDFSFSAGAAASATVTIADLPIDAWRFAKFSAAELADANVSGDEADPDGDGARNIMEYALSLEPKAPSAAGLPVASIRPSGALALTYTRVKSATDITYTAEVGNELGTWHSGAGFTSVVQTVDNGATETITVESQLAPGAGKKQFMRLHISRP